MYNVNELWIEAYMYIIMLYVCFDIYIYTYKLCCILILTVGIFFC